MTLLFVSLHNARLLIPIDDGPTASQFDFETWEDAVLSCGF